MKTMKRKNILFICTQNSARSQMAEGLLRASHPEDFDVFSGGTEPSEVNQNAIQVMAEIGVDISHHRAKNVSEFVDQKFDYVVTVCDQARESCPFFPGGKSIHKSFKDPSLLEGTEGEVLAGFREVRDEIRDWIENTFKSVQE
jgi:arsenate reductase